MANPEVDHGFAYDSQGQIDILQSPFFDPDRELKDSIDDYVDHIIFHLAETINEQRPFGQWQLVGRPPAPPSLATFPWIKIVGILTFLVASFGLLKVSLC
ncbi:hypothetical protein MA16_Dca018241 [Dendrobium catenatum]|uniref:Uncharacterized protein n=1 Tax=Dendrobium catenatum TaxID=906689 RepID=A0A2I0WZZ4_9ASPA|nr:hypothetical protein MA16_Dca018241 [Dendrobium catenatum]